MATGIKLYKHFVDQVNEMGKIKSAWFTTFNLDISFFEKYILSALVGVQYQDIRSAYDYESINLSLAEESETDTEDKIEVKVFYDYRAEVPTGKQKQTTVHLHPVDPSRIQDINGRRIFREGVFHPKIIVLENVNRELWLMVSSANLTFGGWARNREGFFCSKLENTRIARDVGEFFQRIVDSIHGFQDAGLLYRLNNGKIGQEEAGWYFLSSLNKYGFVENLNPTYQALPLQVWSPYFAEDLPTLLDELKEEEYFESINIIPAKNERQKIRIVKEIFDECNAKEGIKFFEERLPSQLMESFTHAKIWLTPKALAIGSWNMTRAGMNICTTPTNNIEAGIIYSLRTQDYNRLMDSGNVRTLKDAEHILKEELEKEKDDVLEKFTISAELLANWDTLYITMASPSYRQLINTIGDSCTIKVSAIGLKPITFFENGYSFRNSFKALLSDRMYEIMNAEGKVLFRGYFKEVGLASRPVQNFENIDDYLKGWVLEKPEDKKEMHRLGYRVSDELGDELNKLTKDILGNEHQNAWFSSFYAFECIRNRIISTRPLKKKERINELKRIGRILPGSLYELNNHLCTLVNLYQTDRDSFKKSPIYLWFLIESANSLFKLFNSEIEENEEKISFVKNLNLEDLIQTQSGTSINREQIALWKKFIRDKIKAD